VAESAGQARELGLLPGIAAELRRLQLLVRSNWLLKEAACAESFFAFLVCPPKKKDRNSYCWRSATGVLDASRRRLLLCRPNCAVSAVLFAAAEIVT
jgi:hypothetical protein